MAFEPSITDPAPTQHTARHTFKGGLAVESAGGKQLEIDETGALVALPASVVRVTSPPPVPSRYVLSRQLLPWRIVGGEAASFPAYDDGYIYWYGNNTDMWRAVADGTGAAIFVAGATPSNIVFDATYVYWSDNGTDSDNIWRATKANPADAAPLGVTGPSPAVGDATYVAVDDTYVYWVEDGEHDNFNIWRALKADGSAGERLVVTGNSAGAPFVVDDTYLYYIVAGDLYRALKADGSGAEVFISGISQLAIFDGYLYWVPDDGSGSLLRTRTDGTGTETLIPVPANATQAVTVGGDYVYWTAGYDIYRGFHDGYAVVGLI